MTDRTIRIFPMNDQRWALEGPPLHRGPKIFPNRKAAIAAAISVAMTEEAMLIIEGSEEQPSAFDFGGVAE